MKVKESQQLKFLTPYTIDVDGKLLIKVLSSIMYGSETHLREVPVYVKSRIVTS